MLAVEGVVVKGLGVRGMGFSGGGVLKNVQCWMDVVKTADGLFRKICWICVNAVGKCGELL